MSIRPKQSLIPCLRSRCSLKNHGADELVDKMFAMGAETMDLPLEEKLKFEQGDDGMSFGYARSLLAEL